VCSLRDAATDFAALDVDVYGISTDDVRAQAAFAEKQKLEFKLLSDPDASAARKYDVLMMGRPFAQRRTFVIDDKGILRHIDAKVDVRNHGGDLARLIRELRE